MTKMCKNLGIMGNAFRVMAGLDSVFGYDIAVDDAFKAIISHGSLEEVTCFYEPMQFQQSAIQRKYLSLTRQNKVKAKLNLFSELDILQQYKEVNIDVLHNISMEFMPLVYVREFFSQKKFPITYTIHGASYPNYIEGFYLMKLLMPFRPYDSLICTSRAVKHAVNIMLENISGSLNEVYNTDIKYQGRLDVIPLGVDTEKFAPMNKSAVRNELGLPEDAFIILWLGRISAYDKADLLPLLMVYKRLIEKNPDKKLLLILAGHDRKNLPLLPAIEKYISGLGIGDNVKIIDKNDVANRNLLFAVADIFTSPIDNVQETFGITPIEAMACGTPQIVSDWDGYRDSVVNEVTGFLIPTYWANCDEDIKHAAMFPSEPAHRSGLHHLILSQAVAVDLHLYEKAIQTLIDNPELRRQMSENSVKIAREKFSWQSVISKYEELWEELCCQQKSSPKQDLRKKLAFMQPIYCKAFSQYPTRFIDNGAVFFITVEGNNLLEGSGPLPYHYSVEEQLQESKLGLEILKQLKTASGEGISMSKMLDSFRAIYNESTIKRSAMWLLKHGLASIHK